MVLERMDELLIALKNGKMEVFDEFYNLTKKKIFINIYSFTKSEMASEDILQNTYIKFLNNINKVKLGSNPLNYLMVISRNEAIDYLRKNKRITYVETNDYDNTFGNTKEVSIIDESIIIKEIKKNLTDEEFMIFIMHNINDLTHKEISKIIKKPLGTVLWKYNKIIKKLQERMESYNE